MDLEIRIKTLENKVRELESIIYYYRSKEGNMPILLDGIKTAGLALYDAASKIGGDTNGENN